MKNASSSSIASNNPARNVLRPASSPRKINTDQGARLPSFEMRLVLLREQSELSLS